MTMFEIEIDIAGEEGYEERTQEWAKKFDCRAEIITHSGPAGGNPLYRMIGSKEDLRRLFTDYTTQAFSDDWPRSEIEEEVEELFNPQPHAI